MAITLQRKRVLFWGLGILAGLLLVNLAWAQICASLTHCFPPF